MPTLLTTAVALSAAVALPVLLTSALRRRNPRPHDPLVAEPVDADGEPTRLQRRGPGASRA